MSWQLVATDDYLDILHRWYCFYSGLFLGCSVVDIPNNPPSHNTPLPLGKSKLSICGNLFSNVFQFQEYVFTWYTLPYIC